MSASFKVNNLNQLTTVVRTSPSSVSGTTTGPATNVTVNGDAVTRYNDNSFAGYGWFLADGTNTFTAVA
jgi:hypothetical protein